MKRPEDYLRYPWKGELSVPTEQPVPLAELCAEFKEHLENRRIWFANEKEFCLKGNQDWYRNYYLNTPYWTRYVRPFALDCADHKCERCGAYNVSLDVHHKTYERLGFEAPEDLEVLCRDCHNKAHGVL